MAATRSPKSENDATSPVRETVVASSEERLRMAQEAAQIGMWEWDPAQNRRTLSEQLLRMFGLDADDAAQPETWASRVHAEDLPKVQSSMDEGHRAGFMEFEYRYQAPGSELRWFYCKGARLQNESRMFGIVQDITERKRAEQALRESEQRFRVITEATPIMVWMSGTDKLCYYFNKSWLDFVGRTLEQEQGNGWAENVHPDDFDRCLQIYVSSFDARRPFEMEYRLRHHSGEYRWILDHGVPRYASDGTFEGYVGGCLDVHDQKEAAVARQRLAAIVESSDDAIVSKDLRGIVTSWNPGAEKMFGWTAREMIGRSIRTIIPPELQDDEERILATIARGERIEHFETVRLTKTGERVEVSLTVSPVKDEAGRIVGAAKIARDITQQKKAERALRTTEKLASVGRMAATIAHEMNNPLEAITNLVYLAKHAAVRSDVQEYLRGAEEELERVAHLTRQTLGFYRETSGLRRMTIGSAISTLAPVFASRSRNKGVTIVQEIEQDPEIYAAPGEIRQLVANLLANCIDAVNTGGRIHVRVTAATDWSQERRPGVRLTVADSGAGIPREIRSQLYQPFFTTKKEIGTGLGLWVCKSIVEKYGGSIRMKSSTAPQHSGAVFSVFLPVSEHGEATKELKKAV